jgi:membrane associated rhomboid family serine protease
MTPPTKGSLSKEFKSQVTILGGFVALFWLIEILDLAVFGGMLETFGIVPHSLIGLRGIIFAPFLHGSMGHLLANTLPFVILGWLVMVQETSDFWIVTFLSAVIGGLGVWFLGIPGTLHVGSSILIFGYLGFLMLRGYFQRNLPSIALSLLVIFLYGGLVWGVLPGAQGISWQGHLFGFIGGGVAAKLIATEKRTMSR